MDQAALIQTGSQTEPQLVPRILLVDDDEVDYRATKRLLRQVFGEALDLDWVRVWSEAVEQINTREHDLYLVDYNLGGRTGLELIQEVLHPERPQTFILLTGEESREVDLMAARAGVADFLVKSEINTLRLERSIRYALEMARGKQELFEQTLELRAANELIQNQTSEYIGLAEDLAMTKDKLQSALKRAEESEERYRRLAEHDLLTGLANRALFSDRLREGLEQAQRADRQTGLLLLDLDRFKTVNDTLGHPVGDALLKGVAERLTAATRKTDTVARLGGDEFAIISTNMECSDDAATLAGKIIKRLAEPFDLDGNEVLTGTSIGIAIYESRTGDVDELFRNADAALYRAKELGRGTYCYFDTKLNERIQRAKSMERDLEAALSGEGLYLAFQPKLDALTGAMTGTEALARWQHPEQGNIPPDQFIPAAESTGLIVNLADWIFREACRQAAAWSAGEMGPIKVAINLSAVQFKRTNILDRLLPILDETNVPPELLELEITETTMIDNFEPVVEQLEALRATGMHIAIDDFGTGYTSLAHVKHLPVDKLKIDRSFVHNLPDSSTDAAIVRTIIALSEALGLGVVAEGVETQEQLVFLRNLGCREIQGFFITKPLPPEEFETWLTRHRERTGSGD